MEVNLQWKQWKCEEYLAQRRQTKEKAEKRQNTWKVAYTDWRTDRDWQAKKKKGNVREIQAERSETGKDKQVQNNSLLIESLKKAIFFHYNRHNVYHWLSDSLSNVHSSGLGQGQYAELPWTAGNCTLPEHHSHCDVSDLGYRVVTFTMIDNLLIPENSTKVISPGSE